LLIRATAASVCGANGVPVLVEALDNPVTAMRKSPA